MHEQKSTYERGRGTRMGNGKRSLGRHIFHSELKSVSTVRHSIRIRRHAWTTPVTMSFAGRRRGNKVKKGVQFTLMVVGQFFLAHAFLL